jgi:DNA invertase Pin-like site-specific DNA recombinase
MIPHGLPGATRSIGRLPVRRSGPPWSKWYTASTNRTFVVDADDHLAAAGQVDHLRDLLNVLAAVGERGAGFRSLNDTWADTTTPHGRLMLTVLGGLAEFERELIRARTGEGRKRAKDRGVKFGRPRKMTPHQRQEALQRLASGETYADVARTFNVDATTIGRLAASSPFA